MIIIIWLHVGCQQYMGLIVKCPSCAIVPTSISSKYALKLFARDVFHRKYAFFQLQFERPK